jgi:hypothetical protein
MCANQWGLLESYLPARDVRRGRPCARRPPCFPPSNALRARDHRNRPSADVYWTSVSTATAPSSGSNSPPMDGAGSRRIFCQSPPTEKRGVIGWIIDGLRVDFQKDERLICKTLRPMYQSHPCIIGREEINHLKHVCICLNVYVCMCRCVCVYVFL